MMEDILLRFFGGGADVKLVVGSLAEEAVFLEELELIKGAVPQRRRDFIGGRTAAHLALRTLGAPRKPILRGLHYEPLWPDGFVGSITHCEDFCCAVAAKKSEIISVGIDAEPLCAGSKGITNLICNDDEKRQISQLSPLTNSTWELVIFSAKEAIMKCFYQADKTLLGFLDVSLSLEVLPDCQSGSFRIVSKNERALIGGREFRSFWHLTDLHVITGCSLSLGKRPLSISDK